MVTKVAAVPRVVRTHRKAVDWIEWDTGERNLLDLETIQLLERDIRAADSDPECTAIVLAGSPSAFCGGLDPSGSTGQDGSFSLASELVELLKMLPKLRKPVLAAVRGDALSAGFAIALLADVAVVNETACLGTVEVAQREWPTIAQVPVRHLLPAKLATFNLVTGIPFSATRLFDLGVISKITSSDNVDPETQLLAEAAGKARHLAAPGRSALADLSVNAGYEADLDAALAGVEKSLCRWSQRMVDIAKRVVDDVPLSVFPHGGGQASAAATTSPGPLRHLGDSGI